MASKYERITDLYLQTVGEVAAPEVWPKFLTTACYNFRLSFDKQILLYAQRPDATAVLPIEGRQGWNQRFGRWVNRGSKGIAILDSDSNGQARIQYYFDIVGTHEGRHPRPVPIWTVHPEQAQAIVETLENSFGTLESKENLGTALLSAASNVMEDNFQDYLAQLIYYKEGSFLEPLDEESLEAIFKPMLQNSIGYMLLVRCGIDPADHFKPEDFSYISGFNTLQTINALGTATSDISQMCLSEIARTVQSLQRQQNRTFEDAAQKEYAVPENQPERSMNHDTDHIYEAGGLSASQDNSIPADPNVRNFSYTIVDGKVYFRENSRMNPVEVSVTAENRIRGMIALRDCVRRLIDYQTEGYPDEEIQKEQAQLNTLYDEYTKKYGLLSSRGNSLAFGEDSSYFLLCSLEVLDEEGNFKRKADMFTKRTIRPHVAVTSVDTASEALAVSIAEKARVDMPFMAELSGKTEQELETELAGVIFRDVNCAERKEEIPLAFADLERYAFVTADEYLSGNVRRKLRMVKALCEVLPEEKASLLQQNVTALEAVQPVDLTAGEIGVRIGVNWVPREIYEQFLYEVIGTSAYARDKIHVLYSPHSGEWNVTNKSFDGSNIKAVTTYGTKRINAYHIFEQTLNQKDVRIYDTKLDANGNEVRVLNKKETAIAQDRQELIKAKFAEWVWRDIDRRERLCGIYNETFNAVRPREYDGQHICFSGMNPEITLRKHQINAIAHIMYGGNTLLAHEVGAGKSATRS